MSSPYVHLNSSASSLLVRAGDCRDRLLAGLAHAENADGWSDPSDEAGQPLWTSIEVLTTLVQCHRYPRNYGSVLDRLLATRVERGALRGWEYEGLTGRVSIFVTADVVRLYVALHRFDDLPPILATLQAIRNDDGGWGVCDGDRVSKVRATSWALRCLLRCSAVTPLRPLIDMRIIARGISWLYDAQRDMEADTGWGNLPDSLPSNTTATILVLDALLEAKRYNRLAAAQLPVRNTAIDRGLAYLTGVCRENGWRGPREEFAVSVEGRLVGRHVSAGLGSTAALSVLLKACDLAMLRSDTPAIYIGVEDLISRCREHSVDGTRLCLLVPSDDSGAPVVWNAAFAIDSFNEFEQFYLRHLADRFIASPSYQAMHRQVLFWRHAALLVFFTFMASLILLRLPALDQLSAWFMHLPALYQGVVLSAIGIAMTAAVNALHRLLSTRSRPLWRLVRAWAGSTD